MVRWLLLLIGVLAAVFAFERDRLAPYAPEALASILRGGASETSSASSSRSQGARSGGAPVAVEVATAEDGALPILRDTIGTILPAASTVMTSDTAGTVASVAVADGATVKRGDRLVSLDDRVAKAQIEKDRAALARDQVTLDQANRDLERAAALLKSGAFTAQQGEDARSAAEVAAAVVEVDRAALQADQVVLDKLTIRAPFDGRLGAFQVSVGALVTPGSEIVRVTQTSPIYAGFTLAQEDLPLIQKALAAGMLTVSLKAAGEEVARRQARVSFIDDAVDAASGTFALRALIDNPDGLLVPGQAISVTVKAGERDGLVLVPTVAVQPRQDGSVVYVLRDDGTVALRKVEVALVNDDRTGLSASLETGERVVTEGQSGLTDGARVKVAADAATPAPAAGVTAAETSPQAANP
ncbi:efflux RND transporter periplasmic adaptor subunit [Aureimonas sp. AU22]|uniref:efflux RND transporter periplasmic adaptor subunit n=1 Tax=Aureimonas sp. AU22 TaxID=1638162 RepID=UPI000784CB5D|nr:efflux RND transporter periplasmic adaptor subunit [Aureimonas sp. AU22]